MSALVEVEKVTTPTEFQTLRDTMLAMPQVEIPVKHYFCNGVYAREIFIPKGTIALGKIHKTEHINIISQGDVTVVSHTGRQRIHAPHTAVVGVGQCAAYAHEDTIWTTFLATTETDPEAIETLFIAPSYDDALMVEIMKLLGGK